MGKTSTSSAKSKDKKASSKSSKLYFSKVVATILDRLIQEELNKVKKHPKTVGKWMAKMRSSILKKVSTSTPMLFKSEKHDMASLDAQLMSNLKEIDVTKAQIVASSRQMWQDNFDSLQSLAKQDADAKNKRHGGKKSTEHNIFADRVSLLNENIELMASQLSSIGKDIENRVTSLSNSIQAAEKLWAVNPMRGQRMSAASVQQRHVHEQEDGHVVAPADSVDVATTGISRKHAAYRDLDAHLNVY